MASTDNAQQGGIWWRFYVANWQDVATKQHTRQGPGDIFLNLLLHCMSQNHKNMETCMYLC